MAEPIPSKPPVASPASPQSHSSNLDSFFKRLGQGQSSRLWAGPGRSGAVPGSLRTRFHTRNNDDAGHGGVGPSQSARRTREHTVEPTDSRVNCATPVSNVLKKRSESADNLSLSPLGTTGGWNELEGNGRRLSFGADERSGKASLGKSPGGQGLPRSRSLGAASAMSGAANTASTTSQSGPLRSRGEMLPSSGKARAPKSSTTASNADASTGTASSNGSAPAGNEGHTLQSQHPTSGAAPSTIPPPPRSSILSPGPIRITATTTRTPTTTTVMAQSGPTTRVVPPGSVQAIRNTASPNAAIPEPNSRPSYRDKRFEEVLNEEVVKLDQLREISWNGVPPHHRATVWQLLVGYMPANRGRRATAMERKRREYRESVPHYFDVPDAARSHQEQNTLRQILVDVPRTCPDVPFFHQEKVQRAMERILYIWAIRHPASGYVQGINDLMTPLYLVFLSAHVGPSVESTDVSKVDEALLFEVEADVYWCLTKLLDNIQDHYTAMQPGLQRMVLRLEELVQRIDADLHRHIANQGLLYIQFAFRWMNCLLMRELPLRAVVRAWDTYLAEENGFESFHVYVSAALLCHFSSTLREMDFQNMVMYLQDMPTKEWGEEEVEPLLSQAYILSTLFEGSPNHLGAA